MEVEPQVDAPIANMDQQEGKSDDDEDRSEIDFPEEILTDKSEDFKDFEQPKDLEEKLEI